MEYFNEKYGCISSTSTGNYPSDLTMYNYQYLHSKKKGTVKKRWNKISFKVKNYINRKFSKSFKNSAKKTKPENISAENHFNNKDLKIHDIHYCPDMLPQNIETEINQIKEVYSGLLKRIENLKKLRHNPKYVNYSNINRLNALLNQFEKHEERNNTVLRSFITGIYLLWKEYKQETKGQQRKILSKINTKKHTQISTNIQRDLKIAHKTIETLPLVKNKFPNIHNFNSNVDVLHEVRNTTNDVKENRKSKQQSGVYRANTIKKTLDKKIDGKEIRKESQLCQFNESGGHATPILKDGLKNQNYNKTEEELYLAQIKSKLEKTIALLAAAKSSSYKQQQPFVKKLKSSHNKFMGNNSGSFSHKQININDTEPMEQSKIPTQIKVPLRTPNTNSTHQRNNRQTDRKLTLLKNTDLFSNNSYLLAMIKLKKEEEPISAQLVKQIDENITFYSYNSLLDINYKSVRSFFSESMLIFSEYEYNIQSGNCYYDKNHDNRKHITNTSEAQMMVANQTFSQGDWLYADLKHPADLTDNSESECTQTYPNGMSILPHSNISSQFADLEYSSDLKDTMQYINRDLSRKSVCTLQLEKESSEEVIFQKVLNDNEVNPTKQNVVKIRENFDPDIPLPPEPSSSESNIDLEEKSYSDLKQNNFQEKCIQWLQSNETQQNQNYVTSNIRLMNRKIKEQRDMSELNLLQGVRKPSKIKPGYHIVKESSSSEYEMNLLEMPFPSLAGKKAENTVSVNNEELNPRFKKCSANKTSFKSSNNMDDIFKHQTLCTQAHYSQEHGSVNKKSLSGEEGKIFVSSNSTMPPSSKNSELDSLMDLCPIEINSTCGITAKLYEETNEEILFCKNQTSSNKDVKRLQEEEKVQNIRQAQIFSFENLHEVGNDICDVVTPLLDENNINCQKKECQDITNSISAKPKMEIILENHSCDLTYNIQIQATKVDKEIGLTNYVHVENSFQKNLVSLNDSKQPMIIMNTNKSDESNENDVYNVQPRIEFEFIIPLKHDSSPRKTLCESTEIKPSDNDYFQNINKVFPLKENKNSIYNVITMHEDQTETELRKEIKFDKRIDERVSVSDTYNIASNSQIFMERYAVKNSEQVKISDFCNRLSSIDRQALSKEPLDTWQQTTHEILDSGIFEMKNVKSETRLSGDDELTLFEESKEVEKGHSEVVCMNKQVAIDSKCLPLLLSATPKIVSRTASYTTIQTCNSDESLCTGEQEPDFSPTNSSKVHYVNNSATTNSEISEILNNERIQSKNRVSQKYKQGNFAMVHRSGNIDSPKSTPQNSVSNDWSDSEDHTRLHTNSPIAEISEYKTLTEDENLQISKPQQSPMSKSDDIVLVLRSSKELLDGTPNIANINHTTQEIEYSDKCSLTNNTHSDAEDLIDIHSIMQTLQHENYSKCDQIAQTDQLNVLSQHTQIKLKPQTPKLQFHTIVHANIIGTTARIQPKTTGTGNRKFWKSNTLANKLRFKTKNFTNKSYIHKHINHNQTKPEINYPDIPNTNENCTSDFQTFLKEPCKKFEQVVQTEEKVMFLAEKLVQTDEIDRNVTERSTQSDTVYPKTSDKGIQMKQAAVLSEQISQTEKLAMFTFEQSAQTEDKNKSTKEQFIQTNETIGKTSEKIVQTQKLVQVVIEESTQTEDNSMNAKNENIQTETTTISLEEQMIQTEAVTVFVFEQGVQTEEKCTNVCNESIQTLDRIAILNEQITQTENTAISVGEQTQDVVKYVSEQFTLTEETCITNCEQSMQTVEIKIKSNEQHVQTTAHDEEIEQTEEIPVCLQEQLIQKGVFTQHTEISESSPTPIAPNSGEIDSEHIGIDNVESESSQYHAEINDEESFLSPIITYMESEVESVDTITSEDSVYDVKILTLPPEFEENKKDCFENQPSRATSTMNLSATKVYEQDNHVELTNIQIPMEFTNEEFDSINEKNRNNIMSVYNAKEETLNDNFQVEIKDNNVTGLESKMDENTMVLKNTQEELNDGVIDSDYEEHEHFGLDQSFGHNDPETIETEVGNLNFAIKDKRKKHYTRPCSLILSLKYRPLLPNLFRNRRKKHSKINPDIDTVLAYNEITERMAITKNSDTRVDPESNDYDFTPISSDLATSPICDEKASQDEIVQSKLQTCTDNKPHLPNVDGNVGNRNTGTKNKGKNIKPYSWPSSIVYRLKSQSIPLNIYTHKTKMGHLRSKSAMNCDTNIKNKHYPSRYMKKVKHKRTRRLCSSLPTENHTASSINVWDYFTRSPFKMTYEGDYVDKILNSGFQPNKATDNVWVRKLPKSEEHKCLEDIGDLDFQESNANKYSAEDSSILNIHHLKSDSDASASETKDVETRTNKKFKAPILLPASQGQMRVIQAWPENRTNIKFMTRKKNKSVEQHVPSNVVIDEEYTLRKKESKKFDDIIVEDLSFQVFDTIVTHLKPCHIEITNTEQKTEYPQTIKTLEPSTKNINKQMKFLPTQNEPQQFEDLLIEDLTTQTLDTTVVGLKPHHFELHKSSQDNDFRKREVSVHSEERGDPLRSKTDISSTMLQDDDIVWVKPLHPLNSNNHSIVNNTEKKSFLTMQNSVVLKQKCLTKKQSEMDLCNDNLKGRNTRYSELNTPFTSPQKINRPSGFRSLKKEIELSSNYKVAHHSSTSKKTSIPVKKCTNASSLRIYSPQSSSNKEIYSTHSPIKLKQRKKLYKCKSCPDVYRQKSNLRKHKIKSIAIKRSLGQLFPKSNKQRKSVKYNEYLRDLKKCYQVKYSVDSESIDEDLAIMMEYARHKKHKPKKNNAKETEDYEIIKTVLACVNWMNDIITDTNNFSTPGGNMMNSNKNEAITSQDQPSITETLSLTENINVAKEVSCPVSGKHRNHIERCREDTNLKATSKITSAVKLKKCYPHFQSL